MIGGGIKWHPDLNQSYGDTLAQSLAGMLTTLLTKEIINPLDLERYAALINSDAGLV